MAEPLRFELFDRKHHDRSRFDCGKSALNEYLRTGLGQHGRKDLTRGYVAADTGNRVVGYFTLAAGPAHAATLEHYQGRLRACTSSCKPMFASGPLRQSSSRRRPQPASASAAPSGTGTGTRSPPGRFFADREDAT